MADIRLVKPQANAVHNVPCATGNRFVLDFPSDAALFAKDGDDLVLSFEDGSSIRLQDFYTTYSKEEMPSFEMEGAEISGEDFFAALGNPDLMPAAGPSAGAATRGGGFNQYGNVELLQGIDRLGGLDISFNWGQEHEDDLYAYGHRDIDYGVSVVPVVPGILDPDIPVVDDPDNPNDGGTGPVVDKLEVWEEGLANGSNPQGENVPTMAHGGMNISAPDGVATIVIGEVTVFANGHLVLGSDGAPVKVDTGEGYLQVTGFNPATGRLEYRYTLTDSTQEHDQGKANEHFTHLLPVTVTDSDGDRGSSTIAVVIRDDEPTAHNDANSVTEHESQNVSCNGNVLDGTRSDNGEESIDDIIGADGHMNDASKVSWTTDGLVSQGENTYQAKYGTITLNADGTYTYTLDGQNEAVRELLYKGSLTEEFTYTITDADGDTDDATLTITIKGADHDTSVAISSEALEVDEAGLKPDGSLIGKVETEAFNSMTITAHDGLGTITIGGVTVVRDGQLVETVVPDGEVGRLTVNALEYTGNGTWRLDYTYTLTGATGHEGPGEETPSDRNYLSDKREFTVEITDRDGNVSDADKATGTITVDIRDDVPYANSDFNAVTEGDPNDGKDVTASGNVITGAQGELVVDTSADIKGADGATVTGVVNEQGANGTEGTEEGALEVEGTYGTLTIYPDGSYTYILDETNTKVMGLTGAEGEEPLKDSFTYTLTDADGDTDTADLTISISGTDHKVIATKPSAVTVDEAYLVGGNDPGLAESHTASGTFKVSAKDGLASVTVKVGNEEHTIPLELQANGTVKLGEPHPEIQDSTGNLTIDKIEGAGEYTVHYTYHLTASTQEHTVEGSGDAGRDTLAHTFTVIVKDQDGLEGSVAKTTLTVDIVDDVPVITGTPSLGEDDVATVIEGGEQSDDVDLFNAFNSVNVSYGADGPASPGKAVYSLELSGESVATNLQGLVGNTYQDIVLVKDGDDIIGVTKDGSEAECFRISINANGQATFKLSQPVKHTEKGPDTAFLETGEGLFTVVYTVTDADGDTASTSYDLGANPVFQIQDSQTLVNNPNNNSAELSFDESFTIRETDRHADGEEPDSVKETTSFDASKLFTITPGADDQDLKGLQVKHSFSLNIVEQETGLQARYTNEDGIQLQGNIVLVQEADGLVTGRIGEDGPKVFTLTIDKDNGKMTLAMEKGASIFHGNQDLYDETATLAGKINVTLTVEDRDHDKSSAEAYVTLKFEDDGPALQMPKSASEIASTVSDDGQTGILSGTMKFDFGADGPAKEGAMVVQILEGEITYEIECVYDSETNTWSGRHSERTFTVSDSTGEFQYFRPISESGKDADVSISVTIKDWDGDTITQTSWDYAPVIDVAVSDGSVKEAGVAGCDTELGNDPNVQYGGDKIASGTITLAQSGSNQTDSDTLTLSLWGGKITHTQLTQTPEGDETTTETPEGSKISFGTLADGATFYLVQEEGGLALRSAKEGEGTPDDYYGTLTFTQNADPGNWTWKFTLHEGKLTNSMTEKEEISLELNLGVSDGALKDDTGKLAITIKGTNDKPYFVVEESDNWPLEAGDAVVTDSDGAEPGIATTVTGTLKGADVDTDNGAGSSVQVENHLIFTVEGLYSSAAGEVSPSDQENQYKPPYAEGSQKAQNLLSSQIGDKVSKEEAGRDYTEITTTYGTLRVYADGEYEYTPKDTSRIGADEYVTETFTVRVTDAHGSWTEKQITITLRDEDASVTDYEDVSLSAREEGVAGDTAVTQPADHDYNAPVSTENPDTATLFRDEDVNDTLTLTSENPTVSWGRKEQELSIAFPEKGIEIGESNRDATTWYLVATQTEDGWKLQLEQNPGLDADVMGSFLFKRTDTGDVTVDFTLDPENKNPEAGDNSSFLDQLNQGEKVTVKLPLTATSSGKDGDTAKNTLTITIEGTNDKPVINEITCNDSEIKTEAYVSPESVPAENPADSQTPQPDLTGTVTASDVDQDNGAGSTDHTVHGLIFTLDGGAGKFSSTTRRTDGGSEKITESVLDMGDGSGSVSFDSEDLSGDFTNQYTTLKTTYGTLTLDEETGKYTYTMDEPALVKNINGDFVPNAIMELGEGQSVTETFTVRVTDEHGSWAENKIVITIQGTNDKPIILNTLEVHGTEDKVGDGQYHEDQKDHSSVLVEAEDYDRDDSITEYCFAKDDSSEHESTVEITAGQLLELLTGENQEKVFTGSSASLKVLTALLQATEQDDPIATLKLTSDGKLTLEARQDSNFIQALNGEDTLTFQLSEVSDLLVTAVDEHGEHSIGADVTLVLHGNEDVYTPVSVEVPHVKEEGVYRDESEKIQDTTETGTGYGQKLLSAEGFFAIDDRDAGRVTLSYTNEYAPEGSQVKVSEASTSLSDNNTVTFAEEAAPGTAYVLGTYGYYEINLNSKMDPDTGIKKFEYEYHLYSDATDENGNYLMPEVVRESLGENFGDALAAVNDIPQGETVEDTVKLTINTGSGDETTLNLSASVSGSNDRPEITRVDQVAEGAIEGYEPLTKLEGDQPGEASSLNSMQLVSDAEGGRTLHITLKSNSDSAGESKFVGKITGEDPDKAEDHDHTDGTTVVNYAFVHTDEDATHAWTITETKDGGSMAKSEFGYITIDAEGYLYIHLYANAGEYLGKGKESWEIFAGLGIRCIDDLGATSSVVNLSGKLVGVDDLATVSDSHAQMWEGTHAYDTSESENPVPGNAPLVETGIATPVTVTVRDPDEFDRFSNMVTVTVNGEDKILDFSSNGPWIVTTENGTFTFTFNNSNNPAKLTYTYTINSNNNDILSKINELNVNSDPLELEDIHVKFTSVDEDGNELGTVSSNITVNVHGTNDAPMIKTVTTQDNSDGTAPQGDTITWGTVGYQEQVKGSITTSDVDNDPSELSYGILTTAKGDLVYGQTNEAGSTVYYKVTGGEPELLEGTTLEDLIFSNHYDFPDGRGSIYVDDNGKYTFSRDPDDLGGGNVAVYITVKDPHGAMDSVQIEFTLESHSPEDGRLPDVTLENDITLDVIEPGADSEKVHAGTNGTASSFDDVVTGGTGPVLTVHYYRDEQGLLHALSRNDEGQWVTSGGIPVPDKKVSTAVGRLEETEPGSGKYEWQYYDEKDTGYSDPLTNLDVYLEIRLTPNDEDEDEKLSWGDGTYSLSTDYGTVYVDRETGELRFELDSRADTLNAGETWTENVVIWINAERQEHNLSLEVTGTGDASVIETESVAIDLENGMTDSGKLTIDDIDNADQSNKFLDTHTLYIGTPDDFSAVVVDESTKVYVYLEGEDQHIAYSTTTPENPQSCYGELSFEKKDDGTYTYTFTAHDTEATKKIKDNDTLNINIPVFVQDNSSANPDGDSYNDLTTSSGEIKISLTGKADTAEIIDNTVSITEEGDILEDSGTTAGEHSHAVIGDLQLLDYDGEGVRITGVPGEHDVVDNGSTVVLGEYGTLVLHNDGTYTYTLNYDAVQSLPEGEKVQDFFTVAATNAAGSTTRHITVNVTGVNDLPTVTVTPVLSVQEQHSEEAVRTVTGRVEAQDVDTGDTLCFGIKTEDGFQSTEHETPVTLYVSGTWENGELKLSLVSQKPEDGSFVGTLTMGTTGEYSFALQDSDVVRALKAGESAELTVQIGATDGHGDAVTRPVTITVHGSNEAPEITTGITISEDLMDSGGFTLDVTPGSGLGYTATDADRESTLSYTFERNGEYLTEETTSITVDGETYYEVTFKIDDDGKITVTYGKDLQKALDALAEGETFLIDPDGLKIVVQDEAGAKTSSELTLTVTGTNDGPVINTDRTQVTDDNKGTLVFTDVDTSDTHTITFNDLLDASGNALTFNTDDLPETLDVYKDGIKIGILKDITLELEGAQDTLNYTFKPDDAYLNTLPVGESKEISFTVTVDDNYGEPQTIKQSFTIVNDNDQPEIDHGASNPIEGSGETTGTLVFSDDDITDTHTVVFDGLRDEEGNNITIDLTVLSQQQAVQPVYLEGELVGKLTVSYAKGENNQHNTITYSFEAADDLNHLQVGKTPLPFTVSIEDAGDLKAEGFKDSLTLVNANDAPEISVIPAQGGNTGSLKIEDADKLDTHTISVLYGEGSYPLVDGATEVVIPDLGVFAFEKNESGWSYSFEADSSVQNKYPVGTNNPVSVSIQVNDGHNTAVTSNAFNVVIEGTNSIPDALYDANITVESLENTSYALSLPASDADGDTLEYAFTQTNGQYGKLVFDEDSGQYTYEINPEALADIYDLDEPLTESFDYIVNDGVNDPVTGTITLNLDLSGLELPVPPEGPEETPGEEETTIPDPSQGDSSETAGTDADEGFKAMVYAIENGEDYAPLFARNTYSLADGEEMYSLSPDEPEENTIDIVAYDNTDYMVDGGEGVSFMVSENEDLTMDDILQGDGQHGPIVSNIDVLITGHGAESLTNMDQLARDYGIAVDRDANALTLDESWQKVDSGHTDTQVFSNGSLTLETSLDVSRPSDDLNVQAAMNQVNNN